MSKGVDQIETANSVNDDRDEDGGQESRVLFVGRGDASYCDNSVYTAKYSVLSFLPVAIGEQFRRKGNVFFLTLGIIMAIAYYVPYFGGIVNPWGMLGSLALVVSISLLQEGVADVARHRSDALSNRHPCTILQRDLDNDKGEGNVDAESGDAPKGRGIFLASDETQQEAFVDVPIDHAPYRNSDGANSEKDPKRLASEVDLEKGESVVARIQLRKVPRREIRAGQLVLIHNRNMVPADLVLLATSGMDGAAYIETSSIDGETNLKLRASARPPTFLSPPPPPSRGNDGLDAGNGKEKSLLDISAATSNSKRHMVTFEDDRSVATSRTVATSPGDSSHNATPSTSVLRKSNNRPLGSQPTAANLTHHDNMNKKETLEGATARIANVTLLGVPNGRSALLALPRCDGSPSPPNQRRRSSVALENIFVGLANARKSMANSLISQLRSKSALGGRMSNNVDRKENGDDRYVTVLTCELPNASVNTFNGRLTMPPTQSGGEAVEVPLSAENFLPRGSFLRNTDWAIGVACFTGKDTKLVKNSSSPPSRLSQLDKLVNRTIIILICVMMLCVLFLSLCNLYTGRKIMNTSWYLGYSGKESKPWPYLPELDPPLWKSRTTNFIQNLFHFTILLSNFVPLSLYVTMELVTRAMMLFINNDLRMYHDKTDTPASSRSTTVTDLGQIKYIFSDKTGTLTQNVMRFKRCSVDGMIFGRPVVKSAPQLNPECQVEEGDTAEANLVEGTEKAEDALPSFHPLEKLLTGAGIPPQTMDGRSVDSEPRNLTFNAEMFLRVMSICHTVVVEKDYDSGQNSSADGGESARNGIWPSGLISKLKKKEELLSPSGDVISPLTEDEGISHESSKSESFSFDRCGKSRDGAPLGMSYQAESPDEGALVSAASLVYGFQFLDRDSSGIRISCSSPSILHHESISTALKSGALTAESVAAVSVSPEWDDFLSRGEGASGSATTSDAETREEVWSVLAVNKFDSTRKRMSVLVRSPPQLGSIPMLLCKGADSSMLDPRVCAAADLICRDPPNDTKETRLRNGGGLAVSSDYEEDFEIASSLAVQSHLGDFASEGLRTLVLGVRIIGEQQCSQWLSKFAAAANSINDRDEMLKQAAAEIEVNLHIVGVSAIEDKLQKGVPETISNLANAGIKLWVLTGDKRETAIEIGYSTKVLTPEMNLLQVAEDTGNGSDTGAGSNGLPPVSRIKTVLANEFMKLVKHGEIEQYQCAALSQKAKPTMQLKLQWRAFKSALGHWCRRINRVAFNVLCNLPCKLFGRRRRSLWDSFDDSVTLQDGYNDQKHYVDPVERRQRVRQLAEDIIAEYLGQRASISSSGGKLSAYGASLPPVFNRASFARSFLEKHDKSSVMLRSLTIAPPASSFNLRDLLVDERALSMSSVSPGDTGSGGVNRNVPRTSRVLAQLFAVDADVRHGRLTKHHLRQQQAPGSHSSPSISSGNDAIEVQAVEKPNEEHVEGQVFGRESIPNLFGRPKALVIEGSALSHLLGNSLLEEMFFAVASCYDAVIACRVSPKQKALLVKMAQSYAQPVPMTLAIGDGANDVGMIQQAHVGIGISGLEGQQAVNSSEFAIAQFRFLEDLLLVHGRWNFNRMARVVLFSFYKNAVLAGLMVVYAPSNLFSGTPIFDEWLQAMFNFLSFFPILFVGVFDRDIEKLYVRKNPELYAAGPRNEDLSLRMVFRWVAITLVHFVTIYFIVQPNFSMGGTATSAWKGLMRNENRFHPGNGEGDYYTYGTTIYTLLIFTVAYKALYETRSIFNGNCPLFKCRGEDEPCSSRLPYTWIGVCVLSFAFYIGAVYLYQFVASLGSETFSAFTGVATHTFNTRSLTWMLTFLVPIVACFIDVSLKVFSNFHFPTQTQIHMEIAAKQRASK